MVMNSFSFCLFANVLISPFFGSTILLGIEILVDRLSFFFFPFIFCFPLSFFAFPLFKYINPLLSGH